MPHFVNDVKIAQFGIVRKHFNMSFMTIGEGETLAKRCGMRILEDTVNKPRERRMDDGKISGCVVSYS